MKWQHLNPAALILAVTIALLIGLAADRLPPSRLVQTDYCWIDMHVASEIKPGKWAKGWVKGYGPCSQEDVYRQI